MGPNFPLHALPQRLRDGGVIAISTAFFTQGINEIQSVANKLFGINKVQRVINQRAIDACKGHVNAVARVFSAPERAAITAHVDALSVWLAARKKKNIELIAQAESFALLIGAGRITSCKSAKDRTGMAVTLEQVRVGEPWES